MMKSMNPTAAAVVAVAIGLATVAGPVAAAPTWSPASSERLIKLPGGHLEKAVDNDFAKSALAAALVDSEERLKLKTDTLADLQAAVERADGDLRVELEHQFLAEKRRYIEMMAEYQDLRRKRAETKVRLYEGLLRRLHRDRAAMTPARAQLVARQTEARVRLESMAVHVDGELFRSTATAESRYARDYAKNLAAIESPTRAIGAHPMNQAPEIDGQPVTQADYLRQLIANNEADLAIIEQEKSVLGHMAKLVALDALALAEGITTDADDTFNSGDPDADDPVTSAIDFFVTQ